MKASDLEEALGEGWVVKAYEGLEGYVQYGCRLLPDGFEIMTPWISPQADSDAEYMAEQILIGHKY